MWTTSAPAAGALAGQHLAGAAGRCSCAVGLQSSPQTQACIAVAADFGACTGASLPHGLADGSENVGLVQSVHGDG